MWHRTLDAWETYYPRSSLLDVLRRLPSGNCRKEVTNRLARRYDIPQTDVHLTYSGTAALHLGLRTLADGMGSEVIVPDYICPSVAVAIRRAGYEPVVTEIDWPTLSIDVTALDDAVTAETAAVVVPHVSGVPGPIERIREQYPELVIVEDVAQAFGSHYPDGHECGTKGDLTVLSFSNKHIGAGKGGALVNQTDNSVTTLTKPSTKEQVAALHVNSNSAVLTALGTVGYLVGDDVHGFGRQCAPFNCHLLYAQLDVVDELNRTRKQHTHTYDRTLRPLVERQSGVEVLTPMDDHVVPLQYLLSVPPEQRDEVLAGLRSEGIHATRGWTLLSQTDLRVETAGDREEAKRAADTVIGLPLSPKADAEAIESAADRVSTLLRSVLQ